MMRLNRSGKMSVAVFIGVFFILFVCNTFTGKMVDDFGYMYSWETGEKITGFFQIFPSLMAHAQKMNGRLVAHFFVHVFEMLPKFIFNIVNSFVFCGMIALMYRFCRTEKRNNLLLLGLFGGVWLFVPAFGQVFLWLDGACNYMWSVVFGLIFIVPFINELLYDKKIKTVAVKILFLIYSFFAGAFSENVSAAFLLMAGLIVLTLIFIQHKKFPVYYVACIGVAFLGYLSMILAPAERTNKGVTMTFAALRNNFMQALDKYMLLKVLLIAFVVLFVLACAAKVKKERLILSVIFVLGSLCSDFLMIAAAYFSDRCLIGSAILLLIADGILLAHVFEGQHRLLAVCSLAVVLLYTAYYIPVGLNDIYVSDAAIKANEAYIYDCKEQGMRELTVPMVYAKTKYSAIYGLKYLDTKTPDTWPNVYLKKYYDLDSIIGK